MIRDLGPALQGLAPFIDQIGAVPEYVDHFLETGFAASSAGKSIFEMEQSQIDQLNQKFLNLEIPFRCLAENKTTKLGLVGRNYFSVEPHHAALDPARTILVDADHVQISRTKSKESELFRALSSLITECQGPL